jgi:hypothetical protein
MIVSHRHQFIFLHCRKTAGSSFKVSAARYLGDDDVMIGAVKDCRRHGISPPKAMIRRAYGNPHWPSVLFKLARGSYWSFIQASIKHSYASSLGNRPDHTPASDVRAAFPSEWERYKKFCIVRNPWDQLVSEYHWRMARKHPSTTFKEFVVLTERQEKGAPPYWPNWFLYTIDDRPVADRFIRFESLVEGCWETFDWLGIEWDGWLPNAKSVKATRSPAKERAYRELYDAETREIVAGMRKREIEYFGYEF